MKRAFPELLALGTAASVLFVARPAAADQMVIKIPNEHPRYVFEAEPHGLLAPFNRFLPGVGFRGSFVVLQNGFVSSINNSVAIGVGFDWVDQGAWVPVAMQWNFWLSRNWSVFGEPGIAIRLGHGIDGHSPNRGVDWLSLWAGGRYHFTDRITLTMRVGRPTLSVGVSFLL